MIVHPIGLFVSTEYPGLQIRQSHRLFAIARQLVVSTVAVCAGAETKLNSDQKRVLIRNTTIVQSRYVFFIFASHDSDLFLELSWYYFI